MPLQHPLIAVNGLLVDDGGPTLKLSCRYADALRRAGGLPVAVVPGGGPREVEGLLERVDGLLLAGGDDFDTERLGLGPTHPAARPVPAEKQDFDFELARAALGMDLPVLGICYGMQLLALLEGGRLLQHLPDDRPGAQQHADGAVHAVLPVAGTRLAELLGGGPHDAVSRHHQAVASLGPRWRACAHDAEGLLEAAERVDHPLAIGVQWHPELAPAGSVHARLFDALVQAAARRTGRTDLALEPR